MCKDKVNGKVEVEMSRNFLLIKKFPFPLLKIMNFQNYVTPPCMLTVECLLMMNTDVGVC